MVNLDEFVSRPSAAWDELDQLVDGRRDIARAARARRCAAARRVATARPPPTSRLRAVASPAIRSSSRLDTLVQHGRQGVYHSTAAHGVVARVRLARILAARARTAGVACGAAFLLRRGADAARRLLGVARSGPGERAGAEPVPIGDRSRARRSGSRNLGRPRVGDGARRSSPTTSASPFFAFARRDCCSGSARSTCCCRTACMLGAVAGLAIGAGNGQAFFELDHRARRARAELHRRSRARAGLRLGWAIIDPGNARRGWALRDEARAAVEIIARHGGVARGRRIGRRLPHAAGHRADRGADRRLQSRQRSTGAWCSGAAPPTSRARARRIYRRARDLSRR